MGVFTEIEKRSHEQVSYFYYPQFGLKAIIAIHNTVLGPSLGGCRMRIYHDEAQALDDVLRLSEGMTYKSSLAGLDLGGGKAVIIADPKMTEGRREFFLKFAETLNSLSGRYITAEDMGTCVQDVEVMKEVTKYAAGYSLEKGGSGDPSPWTALGVFRGMIAASERKYGTKDLTGKRVSVQGVGHVGVFLVEHLVKAGAIVTICDVNDLSVKNMQQKFNVAAVEADKIYDVPCDIYSPNAIGLTVNDKTLARLTCSIIAGGANNQLPDPTIYATIIGKNILYCPDFAINAGGITSVAAEYLPGGYNQQWLRTRVEAIYDTIHKVLAEAEARNRFPEVVAIDLAKERIAKQEAANKSWKQPAMCCNG